MEIVSESELTQGPARLLKAAALAGFYTVGTYGRGPGGSSVVLRGWRGEDRFVVTYLRSVKASGAEAKWSAAEGYWWQREQSSVIPGYDVRRVWTRLNGWSEEQTTKIVKAPELDEPVSWVAPRALPVRISVTELRQLLAQPAVASARIKA